MAEFLCLVDTETVKLIISLTEISHRSLLNTISGASDDSWQPVIKSVGQYINNIDKSVGLYTIESNASVEELISLASQHPIDFLTEVRTNGRLIFERNI